LRLDPLVDNQESTTSRPLVSIIIPHWRGQKILQRSLASLRNLSYRPVEILLVDNGCDDGSIATAEQEFSGVRVLATRKNIGFAGGCNLGLRHAAGKYALLFNDDAEATPNFLEPLVEIMESDPQVAACQPKIRSLEFPEKFDYAGANGGFLDVFGFPFCRGRIFMTLEEDHGQYDEACDLFWASGACCLLRQSALQQVGLLDVKFFAHMEEIDLNWRLHLAGYRVRSVPSAVIRHQAGSTLHPDKPFKIYLNHRNSLIMIMKNYAARTLWWVLPGRLLLDAVAFWYRIFHFDFSRALAIVRAGLHVLRHSRSIYARRREIQKYRRVSDREIKQRIYCRSIVWDYFIAGRKIFSRLPVFPASASKRRASQPAGIKEAPKKFGIIAGEPRD
jgi:GT2 family glycosyltransferase